MAALGGGAVPYERGTPVDDAPSTPPPRSHHSGKFLQPRKQCCRWEKSRGRAADGPGLSFGTDLMCWSPALCLAGPWAVSRSDRTEQDPGSRLYVGGARRETGPCARLLGGDAQPRRVASAPTGQKRGGAGRMSAGQTARDRRGEHPSVSKALAEPVWRIARGHVCHHTASVGCSSSERRRLALRKARVDPGSSTGRAGRDLVGRPGQETFPRGERER